MELTKYKKCTDCGLTLAVNKKNFDYRIRETGKLYINLRCKPCRAIKKKQIDIKISTITACKQQREDIQLNMQREDLIRLVTMGGHTQLKIE